MKAMSFFLKKYYSLTYSVIIGFVIGCVVIFVVFYFDNTIKSTEEVENKLKLPIIGTVPESGGR